jgi:hypothetical protein
MPATGPYAHPQGKEAKTKEKAMNATKEVRPATRLAQLGHRVREAVSEMNYGVRRLVEVQAYPGGDAR